MNVELIPELIHGRTWEQMPVRFTFRTSSRAVARSDVSSELVAMSRRAMVGTVGQIVEKRERERAERGIDCVQLDVGFAAKYIPSLAPVVSARAGR